jgi:hypothetical protein
MEHVIRVVSRDHDIFRAKPVLFSHILQWFFSYIKILIVRNMDVYIFIFHRRVITVAIEFIEFLLRSKLPPFGLIWFPCVCVFALAYFIIGFWAVV